MSKGPFHKNPEMVPCLKQSLWLRLISLMNPSEIIEDNNVETVSVTISRHYIITLNFKHTSVLTTPRVAPSAAFDNPTFETQDHQL